MERVAFLIERTGERVGCLLNPESVVVRRSAGVRSRRSLGGPLTGAWLSDDPLLFTGGGVTELELDLLFDVTIGGSTIATDDVRSLTAPLWQMTENVIEERGDRRPPTVVFVWGKAWRIPGVVLSVAEKLEHFTPEGLPRRSWLRMKFRRVDAGSPVTPAAPPPAFPDLEPPEVPPLGPEPFPIPMEDDSEDVLVHEVVGGGTGYEQGRSGFGERLDELAQRFCGDPAQWRLLASFNGIDDPMRIPAGFLLRIPKPSGSGREA